MSRSPFLVTDTITEQANHFVALDSVRQAWKHILYTENIWFKNQFDGSCKHNIRITV